MLYRCPICDMPMFEKAGLKIFPLQHHNGQPVKTEIDREDSEGTITIRCGSCKKGGHILALIKEQMGIEESVSSKTDPK